MGLVAQDPHVIWTELRQEAPVYYDPLGQVWGISRYQDVLAVEKNPEDFSSRTAPRPTVSRCP